MRMQRGANWFYWIAGLSVINIGLTATGASIVLIIGLGSTQLVEGMVRGGGGKSLYALDALIIGVFVAFGYFANKGMRWAFVLGMLLYALDGALFVMVRDWLAIAFHVLVLYFLWGGLAAANSISQNVGLQRDMMIRASLQKDRDARAQAGVPPPASGPVTGPHEPPAQAWRPGPPPTDI